MRTLRLLVATSVLAFSLLAAPASATTFSTDQSDLWYIPAESGWGIQLVERGNLIFFTIFVYDPAGKPIWYVGTLSPTGAQFVWSGDMYLTTGPWLGAQPYNPALFGGRVVGSMTWTATSVTTGILAYSVDGVAVTKNVVRQTLVNDNFSGHYAGWTHRVYTGCINPPGDGTSEIPRNTYITQNGTAITILTSFPTTGSSCTFTGTVSEFGQMGAFQGAFTCTDGSAGTETWFEVQVNISGLTARHAISYSNQPGCQNNGWFGGSVVTTF